MSSRLAADLRAAILRGDMAPGEKINLDRLRAAQDVSISPLREAVARLACDGLVDFEDQKGFRVAPVSVANLDEVTRMRAALEGLALAECVARGTLDWESDVMRALHVLEHTAPTDLAAWESAHAEFHLALIRGCGMPHLLRVCATLQDMTDRYSHLFPPGPGLPDDHAAIAHAATARQGARAEGLLQDHIRATGAALRARMAAG
jgi:DNA-binding GntR family transcriptional regulator